MPFLSGCLDVTQSVETGDELEVDFEHGSFRNLTRDLRLNFQPLDLQLLDIIAIGGWRAHLERRVAGMKAGRA